MKTKADCFGVNILRWAAVQENALLARRAAGEPLETLLARHARTLAWLQHERLAHLIVTVWESLFALFFGWLFLTGVSGWPGGLLLAALLVLFGFYIVHYFRLENTVQHWYRLADTLRAAPESSPDGAPPRG